MTALAGVALLLVAALVGASLWIPGGGDGEAAGPRAVPEPDAAPPAALQDVDEGPPATATGAPAAPAPGTRATSPEAPSLVTGVDGWLVDSGGIGCAGVEVWAVPVVDGDPPARRRYLALEDGFQAAARATTRGDGTFELRELSPGEWWVGPAATRGPSDPPDPQLVAPVADRVVVEPGRIAKARFDRYRGLYVRGEVHDRAGAPRPWTTVTGDSRAPAGALVTSSDADGAFALGPLHLGALRVSASTPDARSAAVQARAGQRDVVLVLSPGAPLRGRVVDAGTGRGREARVLASRGGGRTGARTDPDGAFELPWLPAEPHDLLAVADDGGVALLRGVVPGAGDVRLELAPGAELLVVSETAATSFTVLLDGLEVGQGDASPGEPARVPVPPGHLTVLAGTEEGDETKHEVDAEAGETVEVRL